jgi:hypothetical protein
MLIATPRFRVLEGRAMNASRAACLVLLLASTRAAAVAESDIPFPTSASLPPDALAALRDHPASARCALRADINPYFVQGDFNGDDQLDTAVLIRETATGKDGIAVVHGSGDVHLLGAGRDIGNGGDDFDWLDAWYVFAEGTVQEGLGEEDSPPELLGDALMVIKTESASALIYWTGKDYAWYQQGD